MLLKVTVHLDKKMSLFTLLTAWEVFLSVRDAPTGELRSRLSHFPSTHLNMVQDFPALLHLDVLHLQIQMHCERLTAAIGVVAEICQSQYSMWNTACDAADLQKYKNKQMKKWEVRFAQSQHCNISIYFFFLAGAFIQREVQYEPSFWLLKELLQSAITLNFQQFFRNTAEKRDINKHKGWCKSQYSSNTHTAVNLQTIQITSRNIKIHYTLIGNKKALIFFPPLLCLAMEGRSCSYVDPYLSLVSF